jgi:hypothetical protein
MAASVVEGVDVGKNVETVPIESERAKEMIEDHHGEFVNSPHLFTEEMVYYGVAPVAKALPGALVGR